MLFPEQLLNPDFLCYPFSVAFPLRSIGIIAKRGIQAYVPFLQKLSIEAKNQGVALFFDDHAISALGEGIKLTPEHQIDLLLTLGGDGTILRAIRKLPHLKTPILGINFGTLGFLSEVTPDEFFAYLPAILSGKEVSIDERSLLAIEIMREDGSAEQLYSFNEAVISQNTISRLIKLRTKVNGEEVATYHADGLIVATPTGSTAYSLSAGGPIVSPGVPALILTPICPHSFSQKPIVLPDTSIIEIVSESEASEIAITLDGQRIVPLDKGDRIVLKKHTETVQFLRLKGETYFHTLRGKLGWAGVQSSIV